MNNLFHRRLSRSRLSRKLRPCPIETGQRSIARQIVFERLEDRCVLNASSLFATGAIALPTDPTVEVSGNLPQSGSQQLYQVTLDTQGQLIATAQASTANTLLSLEDSQGNVVIQSEATSLTDLSDRIAQHLPAGTYYVSVSNLKGSGNFTLATNFTAANPPGEAISETEGAYEVTTADLTKNGKSDLIVPDYYYNQVLINYGVGDGTFQPPVAIPVGQGPSDVIAEDLSGDGHLDLVVVDQLSSDLMIFQGDGQGNFQLSQVLPTQPGPVQVVAGDFSGDGLLDLAVANKAANGVEIFHNQGNGTFAKANWIGSIPSPSSLTVANLNGDRFEDLAVASGTTGTLDLLDGQGNDQFTMLPSPLDVGPDCSDVIAANFSGTGLSDLAAVSPTSGKISLFHNDGFAYRLKTTLQAGASPETIVAADLNGDGNLDITAVNFQSKNVSVFLNKGNDSFSTATDYDTGAGPFGLAAADFNGDGRPDLVTTDSIGLTVSVLINNGDATFTSPPIQAPSAGPQDVVVADLTGNGIEDLVVPDIGINAVEVFLGRGDGTFRDPILIPAGSGPEDVAVGDFDGSGIPGLAVVDYNTNTLLILKGSGNGQFTPIQTLPTGEGPEYMKTADLDGDGHLDLIVADYLGNTIDIFYGKGDGTFSQAVNEPAGLGPSGIAIADLNGDGRPDIAVSDSGSNVVDVFLANGPRSFDQPVSYQAGAQPWFVAAGDFNNDGHPDLVVSDGLSSPSVVSLLVNNGNGTFQAPVGFGVGGSPYPLAIGDLNGDGNLDIVTGNDITNDVSVLMGNGNGTFKPETRLPAGIDPFGIALGDFTGNGRLDIVEVNYQSSNLLVDFNDGQGNFSAPETIPLLSPKLPTITAELEGNGVPQVLVANPETGMINVFNSQGDGTLQLINTIDVGGSPSGMVVGDFNGDGRPDLAVTDSSNGEVLILLGLGDGTFESPVRYKVGQGPRSPVVGDFRNNGNLDIAVADTDSNEISVLMGNGDGTFQPAVDYPSGEEPVSMIVGYTNNQSGYLDLGTVNRTSRNLTEFFGGPGGVFVPASISLAGLRPTALIEGDFDGDGQNDLIILDGTDGALIAYLKVASPNSSPVRVNIAPGDYLATSADLYNNGKDELILANLNNDTVTIFSNWQNNTFANQNTFSVDVPIAGLSVVDLNGDGFPDLLITQAGSGDVQTYLSSGTGDFSVAEATVPLPHPSPLVFLQGAPGQSNLVSIDSNGQVYERFGVSGTIAQFNPPVNLTLGTGDTIRDYAIVKTGGPLYVALLLENEPLISMQNTEKLNASGRYFIPLPAQGNYTRLVSGDLFGTGLDDLILINRTLNELIVYEQVSNNVFKLYGNPIPAGFGPTDVTLANLTPGGLPDLVVADGSSGTVTIIGRTAQGGFSDEATLPGGLAPAGTVMLSSGLTRSSPDQPVGVTSGVFDSSGLTDVVVVDHGTDRISILQGLPGGGLGAPTLSMTYSTGLDPIQVVAAPLTKDGLLDLVVLNEGSDDLSIFLNNGHGGFTVMPRVDAGDHPGSVAVSDVTGDGLPDLVVSNSAGDILILAGNGDGTFQPYERADGTVNLAVGDLTGDGKNDFVLTSTAQDLLSVQTSSSTAGFVQGRDNGLIAPGPVAIADMNGDGIPDLIVTNTGGNDVLVYLGLGGGHFAAPQKFFTGTAPVGLTVANLIGNGLPDLVVANSGSNDVTILLGTTQPDGSWSMEPGPRLKAGLRPVSTTVADVFGDGEQDILVVNQDSDNVTVLRPIGSGFYDDTNPLTLDAGRGPVQAFVGHFSSSKEPGIVILNSLSNNMTFYANISAAPITISSGGIDPVAGVEGDFENSGYSDLAIANNGDSRISIFDGGPAGLTLAQTILLGASARPTDLVVTKTKGSGLQLFVGAEGHDQAIAITVNSVIQVVTIGSGPTDSTIATTSPVDRSTSTTSTTSSGFGAGLFEATASVASSQSQESATTGAASSTSVGAVSLASATVTTLGTAAQPLFSPSSRTIGWLLDNLVQFAQGQTAEILPIGKNEMAAVAVLLSASNLASARDERTISPSPVPTEDDPSIAFINIPSESGRNDPSPLDRFVANLGEASFDFSNEFADRKTRQSTFSPEWVWHRRPNDPNAITVTFETETPGTSGPRANDPDSDLGSLDSGNRIAVKLPDEAPKLRGTSMIPWWQIGIGSAALVVTGVVVARKVDMKKVVISWNLQVRPALSPNGTASGHSSGQDRSSVAGHAIRLRQDLPPWLQSPMAIKRRPGLMSRTLGSTFSRRSLFPKPPTSFTKHLR